MTRCRAVADRSDALVVLADQALTLLEEDYGIGPVGVRMIPHGVPDLPFEEPDGFKASIGAEGRTVLMTFGLLGPDKGIEAVLEALPTVVAAHPDVLYVVLGATHPEVQRHHGEVYREALEATVARLGLAPHVAFHDRYVELDELCRFLGATDVYVTPYRSAEQIVSGTLAYAAGMGRAIVSTPYRYASELLGDGRGRLVPFDDVPALASTLVDLLDHPGERARMRRRCYDFARAMTWPAVARAYTELFEEVVSTQRPRRAPLDRRAAAGAQLRPPAGPHRRHRTVPARAHGVPDRAHGYCTDDISRALVVVMRGAAGGDATAAAALAPRYLSFLRAAQRPDGTFENLLGYDRRFVPESDSGDTLGQAVWGLGATISASPEDGWRALACQLFQAALPAVAELHETRPMAYAISGLYGYLERFPGALAVRRTLRQPGRTARRPPGRAQGAGLGVVRGRADLRQPPAAARPDAGRTGLRPHRLDGGGAGHPRLPARRHVLRASRGAVLETGHFDFVGNTNWYPRDGQRSVYGQQPIEAGYTADACMLAYEITGEARVPGPGRGGRAVAARAQPTGPGPLRPPDRPVQRRARPRRRQLPTPARRRRCARCWRCWPSPWPTGSPRRPAVSPVGLTGSPRGPTVPPGGLTVAPHRRRLTVSPRCAAVSAPAG